MPDNAALAAPHHTLSIPTADASADDHVRTRAEWIALGLSDEHLHALLTLGLAHSHDPATLSRLCVAEQLLTVTPLGWRVVEQLRQAHDGEAAVIPSRLAKPEWRAAARELWYGSRLLKVYRRHAANQMILLDAFQQAGWPAWMASPLAPDSFADEVQILRDTIKNVNRGHRYRLLRFVIDVRCRSVGWRFVPPRK